LGGAIVVPTGFLTAKTGVEKNVLHYIVDKKIISGVISIWTFRAKTFF
jgi:type I restriction enzyme M protein